MSAIKSGSSLKTLVGLTQRGIQPKSIDAKPFSSPFPGTVYGPRDRHQLVMDWFVRLVWEPGELTLHSLLVAVAVPGADGQHVRLKATVGLVIQANVHLPGPAIDLD